MTIYYSNNESFHTSSPLFHISIINDIYIYIYIYIPWLKKLEITPPNLN
ncbi:MAG: hypothetical protein N7Q72_03425 [Spiroplasma sp. Tabriz.8]|nr:hypothetical protein [Spiroplasma sp. Tabriz.8]